MVPSFRSGPWVFATFVFENDKLSAITLLEYTPNDVEAALYHAARPDRFSSVGYTPADVEAALKKILTAAVKEYGKPDELRLFRGDTNRLVNVVCLESSGCEYLPRKSRFVPVAWTRSRCQCYPDNTGVEAETARAARPPTFCPRN